MKAIAILLIALVLSSTMALQTKSKSLVSKQKIDKLVQGKGWSSIIIKMAFLQAKANNPVDELVVAIEKILSDLNVKTEQATQDFDKRTGEHHTEVKRLNSEIENANVDISHTESFLNEVLRPMKVQLEEDIAKLIVEIAQSRIFLEEAALQREREHNDFVQKITDIDGGLAAIQEALGILDQLVEGGSSFAQIKKAKNSLNKVQRVLSKNTDAALIKALVQVATSSEFADQGLLSKLFDMLHNVSNSLKDSQVRLTADENRAQEDYTKLVAAKENEIKQFESEIIDKKGQLESTVKNIADSENFLVQRKNDVVSFQSELNSENASYENDTKIYEDLMAEFAREVATCNEALDIVRNVEFASYISDRVSQKGQVIGSNHGDGVQVN